jgi:hypothetical protein
METPRQKAVLSSNHMELLCFETRTEDPCCALSTETGCAGEVRAFRYTLGRICSHVAPAMGCRHMTDRADLYLLADTPRLLITSRHYRLWHPANSY